MNILWLDEPECQDAALVGNKVANLSRLATKHRVPIGFCITATAFAAWAPDSSISPSLRAEVEIAYQNLAERCCDAHPAVAVRSSAIGEDGAAASFAGQHQTLLNVTSATAVIEAVGQCWASARSPQAMAYRQQRGLPIEQVECAVLVQQLIDAEVSVVAFSMNPVTGERDEVLINAAWGLGEGIVSGRHTPDSFVVRKADHAITSRAIADKAHRVVRVPNGVATTLVPEDRRQQPSLSDQQIQVVAELAIALEAEVGWPVDVECAWHGQQLYLLQCRPVTTVQSSTGMADATNSPALQWDRPSDNEATWFGGKELVRPMQQSLSLYYYQGWAKAFRSCKAIGGLRARFVDGYEYRLWTYSDTLPPDQADPARREVERSLPERWAKEWLPEIQADLAQWRVVEFEALPDDVLACHLHEMLTRQLRHWEIHAYMGSVPLDAVNRLVNWHLERFPGAPESEPYTLLQGQVNTSLESNHQLWELSTRLTPQIAEALRKGDALPESFNAAFEVYLNRFGHDTPARRERAAQLILSYAENHAPDPLLETERLAAEREAFTTEVRAKLAPAERSIFDDLLAVALANNPLTEDHNLWLDQLSDTATKRVIAEFARRLTALGILDSESDVDYLTVYELIQWGFGLADPLQPRVTERKAHYARFAQQQPPSFIGQPPGPPGEWVDRFSGPALPLKADVGTIRGMGASAGIARGRALVATTLHEALALQRGEMLVCPTTDPEWTALFALAGGLVTNYGGSLCHGAVLAREYRLPAVVGTHVATQQIKTGDWIEVDGVTGVVRLQQGRLAAQSFTRPGLP